MSSKNANMDLSCKEAVLAELDSWMHQETAAGLKDVKFSVGGGLLSKLSARTALCEFLQAEKKIKAGITEPQLTE